MFSVVASVKACVVRSKKWICCMGLFKVKGWLAKGEKVKTSFWKPEDSSVTGHQHYLSKLQMFQMFMSHISID